MDPTVQTVHIFHGGLTAENGFFTYIHRPMVIALVVLLIPESSIPAHYPRTRSVASQPFQQDIKPQPHRVGERVWLQRSTEDFERMIELFRILIVVVITLLYAHIKTCRTKHQKNDFTLYLNFKKKKEEYPRLFYVYIWFLYEVSDLTLFTVLLLYFSFLTLREFLCLISSSIMHSFKCWRGSVIIFIQLFCLFEVYREIYLTSCQLTLLTALHTFLPGIYTLTK